MPTASAATTGVLLTRTGHLDETRNPARSPKRLGDLLWIPLGYRLPSDQHLGGWDFDQPDSHR